MRIIYGDLWDAHAKGAWVVVTTNTQLSQRGDGTAAMGRGIAQAAAQKFPGLALKYGRLLQELDPETGAAPLPEEWHNPELPWLCEEHRLVLFPTKLGWRDNSRVRLIHTNLVAFDRMWCTQCAEWDTTVDNGPYVGWPPLGCGNGGLNWESEVKPLMERYLMSPRYTMVLPESWRGGQP